MTDRKEKIANVENNFQTLYDKALEAAKNHSLEDLFIKTHLSISWLRKFRVGKIPNPSVHKIERLLRATGNFS